MTPPSVPGETDGSGRPRGGAPAARVAGPSTEDARYRRPPYEPSGVGHAGIRASWQEDEGRAFTVTAEPVAVEGGDAVVRLQASTASYSPAAVLRPLTTRSATTREATQAWT